MSPYEKFRAALKVNWEAVTEANAGKVPNTIAVGIDKMAELVTRSLADLGLKATVIVDSGLSPKTILYTYLPTAAESAN